MAKTIAPALDPNDVLEAIVEARREIPRIDERLTLARREVAQLEARRAETLKRLAVNVAALKKAVPAAELHDWLGKAE